MRIVPIEQVKSGMRLGRPIYRDDNDGILLRERVELTPYCIQRIRELNYSYLYIMDPHDLEETNFLLEPVKMETRFKAERLIRKTICNLERSEVTEAKDLRNVVSDMIDQILNENEIIYNMVDIRSHDGYTYAHSVNVCIISLMIGSQMGMSRSDMEKMGIGALLHDVGKIFIDAALLNKPGKLDDHEYDILKEHARKGYDLLKGKLSIGFVSSHVALQHHERGDGSGYPRGLTGWRIHRFAKIVAVADVYDAMTSHRVYRRAIPSHMVIESIREEVRKEKFDAEVVSNLCKVIAPYPIGSILLLSNGEMVLVGNVSKIECLVRVLSGANEGKVIDLYKHPNLLVIERLN